MTTSPSQPIRVMLVDDHTMVRRGLATFLKVFDDLQLVGEAESGEAAIQLCHEALPDVILMDMVLPVMDGAAATRAIRQKFPQVQVIALSSFKEGTLIIDLLNPVNKELVWRTYLKRDFKDREKAYGEARKDLDKAFTEFPPSDKDKAEKRREREKNKSK